MHQSSYNIIICLKELVEKNFPQDKIKLLDVGSYGVNGTYKQIFSDSKKYLYTGLDLNPGPNKEGGDDIILGILESQGDGKTFRRSRE
jgi:hypothetical protein